MSIVYIRRAGTEDIVAITALTHAAYSKWVPIIGREPLPMKANYEEVFKLHRFDLLYEDDVLVALIETVEKDGGLLIENVAVLPTFQKRGYGRMLLEHAEKLVVSRGFSITRLYTNSKFEENIRLYKSIGYAVHHEEPANGGIAVHMEKNVSPIAAQLPYHLPDTYS
ncbi:GNAT family N-acetyltransferase [Beijerinckia indica]|uniref:GCN5-related N-acetyltransferase n=1 Tax=Beijerinckia indica subsp. indica (strain ATCC 9039 / DSM 1715 / NCIMB 8712) TaxID=395963 RepID=B2IHA9_BEII9|nr:GNAT family N-acetyltransferase [Beijerinckia indica]ACB95894.1 GCN5-related N-acetyltransferase [Beijerinckia indica subsp. indica ATCC 9039]